ncbi:hypothetical protein MBOT_39760 [Mycobacterium botniense]|uniref:Uncharacterized protein n=1 Tax=Mycobacterium botniense TaxID=84962 RepID=A0A7I9Y3H9_9MYCO|nr:hypothetical protein MBOT_39760 [Mycobacterium botniense]
MAADPQSAAIRRRGTQSVIYITGFVATSAAHAGRNQRADVFKAGTQLTSDAVLAEGVGNGYGLRHTAAQ